MPTITFHLLFLLVSPVAAGFVQADEIPRTVEETWALFDPKSEPLETEILRERTEDGITVRHIRYVVGTFKGKKTRVAALYAFPHRGENLPAIVQLHGGGQRAEAETVKFWASQGDAGLILTPGAKELPDKVKTHWQGKVPRFHNLRWEGG